MRIDHSADIEEDISMTVAVMMSTAANVYDLMVNSITPLPRLQPIPESGKMALGQLFLHGTTSDCAQVQAANRKYGSTVRAIPRAFGVVTVFIPPTASSEMFCTN